jgi:hypothetical protein
MIIFKLANVVFPPASSSRQMHKWPFTALGVYSTFWLWGMCLPFTLQFNVTDLCPRAFTAHPVNGSRSRVMAAVANMGHGHMVTESAASARLSSFVRIDDRLFGPVPFPSFMPQGCSYRDRCVFADVHNCLCNRLLTVWLDTFTDMSASNSSSAGDQYIGLM